MFICHSLETQRRELEAKGEDVSAFPIVKCYDRADGPGGVWRSDRTHEETNDSNTDIITNIDMAISATFSEEKKDDGGYTITNDYETRKAKQRKIEVTSHTPNMYSGLWTNGTKELFEMSDYTFRDHFGDVRMPTFLPRKHVLGYLLGRVTKNCPDFFEKHFCFRTTVLHVKFVEEQNDQYKNKFRVLTRDENTGAEQVGYFDKCIWAGGQNGIPNVPKPLVNLFEKGGFTGRMVHSSDTSKFKTDVQGKDVLLVGGGLSAEDLALMAIKEGVSKIYISHRGETSELHETRWPYDMVKIHKSTAVEKVVGKKVVLGETYWSVKESRYIPEPDGKKTVLNNIDTVIFCTGYAPNHKMLDQSLLGLLEGNKTLSVPDDWTMKENELSKMVLGENHPHIKPDKNQVYRHSDDSFFPINPLYKGCFSMQNTNMIFCNEFGEVPLINLDINSWMIAKVVTNQVALPSVKGMREESDRIHFECLQSPTLRYYMDWKYSEAIDTAIYGEDGKGSWNDELTKLWEETDWSAKSTIPFRLLGETMNKYNYPVSYLKKDGKTFSEYYDALLVCMEIELWELADCKYSEDEEDGWRTFRDHPEVDKLQSYFTGIRATMLPKPWVEHDENDKLW